MPDPPHFSTLKPDDTSDGEQYPLSYGQRLVEHAFSFGIRSGKFLRPLLQFISDRNAARREEDRDGLWQEAFPEALVGMRGNLSYPKNIRASSNDVELYRFKEE